MSSPECNISPVEGKNGRIIPSRQTSSARRRPSNIYRAIKFNSPSPGARRGDAIAVDTLRTTKVVIQPLLDFPGSPRRGVVTKASPARMEYKEPPTRRADRNPLPPTTAAGRRKDRQFAFINSNYRCQVGVQRAEDIKTFDL